jgi:allophanate hydrolase subunit 1
MGIRSLLRRLKLQPKKDIQKKIEGLARTLEAMKFYALYEAEKKEKNLFVSFLSCRLD